MAQAQTLTQSSEAAIFGRIWDAHQGSLTPELARQILRLGFAESDKTRMHQLAAKNQEGQLTHSEAEELDNYIRVGDLLAILQSRARGALNLQRGRVNGDG